MQPIITIQHLRKNYGNKEVLKDISLEIYPGQVIGYIGPNGAGKSTTVKILCGLISDYSGEITIDGLDLRQNILTIKNKIGYVPESAELYEVLTPNEFLHLMGAMYHLPHDIIQMKIEGIMSAFSLQYELNKRIETFSKGMKQKVLIASALLHNPSILFLDEPLSGLDANSVIMIKNLIRRLADEGKTIFYCSHMMDIVEKVSDKIILIDHGKIIAHGTFAELKIHLGDKSLETMFSNLTGNPEDVYAVANIVDAMKSRNT